MDASTGIAIYAAALSTGIAGFEVVRWRLAHRTRVRIELSPGWSVQVGPASAAPDRYPVVLWVEVINEGDSPEQLATLVLDHPDESGVWDEHVALGVNEPLPGRSRLTYLFAEAPAVEAENAHMEIYGGLAPGLPFRMRAVLGTGREACSDSEPPPPPKSDFDD